MRQQPWPTSGRSEEKGCVLRTLRWNAALFVAAMAFPLYHDLAGSPSGWPLDVLAAHALGGGTVLFALSAVIPIIVYDVRKLDGGSRRFPFGLWAVTLALLVGLAAYGG
jgi:hypothetical protein